MKQTIRRTRSATRIKKSQRVEIFVKKEEDTKITKKVEVDEVPSLDPKVKVEIYEIDLKSPTLKHENEKGRRQFLLESFGQ